MPWKQNIEDEPLRYLERRVSSCGRQTWGLSDVQTQWPRPDPLHLRLGVAQPCACEAEGVQPEVVLDVSG